MYKISISGDGYFSAVYCTCKVHEFAQLNEARQIHYNYYGEQLESLQTQLISERFYQITVER